jgi:gamma-glutamylcyclotransferase (GGCT)/AIG2-like uncharacterized protein YtfP
MAFPASVERLGRLILQHHPPLVSFVLCAVVESPHNGAPMDPELLFVYGSLMRGESNYAMLSGATFVSPACSVGSYTLVDRGFSPGLLAGGDTVVSGELYQVTRQQIERLDVFEEHPHVYRRAPISLIDGRTAHAYFLAQPADGASVIVSGDWRRR